MENNNPERALGAGGELSPELQEQIAIIAERAARGFDRLRDALIASVQPVAEAMKEIFQFVAELYIPYALANEEWEKAYLWAIAHRPKWVRIYNRTKKRRTRKKYRDKILREYRKEQARCAK